MNRKLILKIVGVILLIEAFCLLAPLLYSCVTGEDDREGFLYSMLICAFTGGFLARIRTDDLRLQTRDGFVCVALCWIALSLFGALPYFFNGCGYIDAVFETVSGLTTTGASVFLSPEILPHGILLWRSLTQWMGGMGVLVMVLALLPKLSEGSVNLMRAESPGPINTKLRPKTSETARVLYRIYIALTAAEAVLLRIAGLPWFDAVTTSLTTISTGGFSVRDSSILFYHSEAVSWIVLVFMFLSAVNFSLLFLAVRGQIKDALKSEELRAYTLITAAAAAVIALDLVVHGGFPLYESISNAAFQVVSVMTTTGFFTVNFDLWPHFSRSVLLVLMFVGGCSGSTAGGVKTSRVIVLFKSLKRELQRILHSREVHPICLDGQRVEETTVSAVTMFFFAYTAILLLTAAILSLDGLSFANAFPAAMSALSNVGPGLAQLGTTQNFGALSIFSKLTLSWTMLLGRLEIMPLLVLLMPSVWRRK